MRDVFCMLLALTLLFTLTLAASRPALPPGREAAWWGLLFPDLWGGEGETVTFSWPLLHRVLRVFRNG